MKPPATTHNEFLSRYADVRRGLWAYLLTITRDPTEADDLLQEVSTILWSRFDQWEGRGPFRNWCMVVARNVALQWIARQDRRRKLFSDKMVELLAEDPPAMTPTVQQQRLDALKQCVSELDEHPRQVIAMKYLQGMRAKDIARTLGRSLGSVEMALLRARRRLRACVNRRLGEGEPR